MIYTDRLPDEVTATPDGALRAFMNAIYNQWFNRWKGRAAAASDEEWSQMIDEADAIIEATGGSRTAEAIGSALMRELEARRAAAASQRQSA